MNGNLPTADSVWYFEEDIFKEPEEELICPLLCPHDCPLQKSFSAATYEERKREVQQEEDKNKTKVQITPATQGKQDLYTLIPNPCSLLALTALPCLSFP